MNNNYKIVFFGGEPLGVPVLEILKSAGIVPDLIVASPDRPAGRNLVLTPPRVKVWADDNKIEVLQPPNLKDKGALSKLTENEWDLFVVVAYNHILPEWLLELPKRKTINLHPSLLPYLRGPSPIRTAILEDKKDFVGVTVILLDKEMDHGPILMQEALSIAEHDWPMDGLDLDEKLIKLGGELLATTIPLWLEAQLEPKQQEHNLATYTKKFTKDQAELMIDPKKLPLGVDAYKIYLKICAFSGVGGTYFFYESQRIKINNAHLEDETLVIDRVTQEGKKEMDFGVWLSQT